jgi:hypothetical protein
MTTAHIQGKNFTIEPTPDGGSQLRVFECVGFYSETSDGLNIVKPMSDGHLSIIVGAQPISPKISEAIARCVEDGTYDDINNIEVTAETAALLFSEGLLTPEDFEDVREEDDALIHIIEFEFEELVVELWIMRDVEHFDFAFLDADDNTLFELEA